jgi:DNA-binding transcriptional ArsR family regulator
MAPDVSGAMQFDVGAANELAQAAARGTAGVIRRAGRQAIQSLEEGSVAGRMASDGEAKMLLAPSEPVANWAYTFSRLCARKAAAPNDDARRRAARGRHCADPTRARILYGLTHGPLCVRDLLLGVSEPAVSHQLRFLRARRLVKPDRRGWRAMKILGRSPARTFRRTDEFLSHAA